MHNDNDDNNMHHRRFTTVRYSKAHIVAHLCLSFAFLSICLFSFFAFFLSLFLHRFCFLTLVFVHFRYAAPRNILE